MFHEITDQQLKRKRRIHVAIICAVAALLIAAWAIFGVVQNSAREQGAAALRESIMNAAKQCCAIEGSYPNSLEHLERYYGVSINHDDYVVSYESFASNIMPTVVVTPR